MPSLLRRLSVLTVLATTIFAALPAPAEEPGSDSSLVEDIKNKTQPLFKALSLLGTPYRFGGNNPEKGLDCSGFVKHVYKEASGISLPRSARDMSKTGEQVAQTELKPGDLVFFNTRRQPNSHVGIYKGEGEFVHASSSHTRKVTISRMDQKYWATRFNGARRVLPAE